MVRKCSPAMFTASLELLVAFLNLLRRLVLDSGREGLALVESRFK